MTFLAAEEAPDEVLVVLTLEEAPGASVGGKAGAVQLCIAPHCREVARL